MALPHTSSRSKGFSLVELVIALALLMFFLVSVLWGQWSVGDTIHLTLRTIVASRIAEELLLNTALLRAGSDVDLFSQHATSSGVFGISYRSESLPFSACLFKSGVTASWTQTNGVVVKHSFSLIEPDGAGASERAGDCGGVSPVFSDANTEIRNSSFEGEVVTALDVDEDNVVTGLGNELRFVSRPTGEVFSVTMPAPVQAIDLTPVAVYVALQSSTTQIAVVDRSTRQIVATSTLPGVAGARPGAVSVRYAAEKLFVGTKRTAGHEFHMFDLSNPLIPVWFGSREMNHNINDIAVTREYAFLATSGNVRDLIVLRVDDQTSIHSVAEVNLPGNEDGRSVALSHNYIALGRYKHVVPTSDELWLLRFWPEQDGGISVEEIVSAKTSGDVTGVLFSGGAIQTATTNPVQEFQLFSLDSSGRHLTQNFSRNLPARATGIDIQDEVFFVGTENGLYELGI